MSYLFIAIVWMNHHYLMRYATEATPRLLWFNFAHLFSMSLLPLSTAWMAVSRLAPQPVAFYAAVFFLVNATYMALIRELVDRAQADAIPSTVRRIMRLRSIVTLCLFAAAGVVALKYPLAGLSICIGCLTVYLKPDPPGSQSEVSRERRSTTEVVRFEFLNLSGMRAAICRAALALSLLRKRSCQKQRLPLTATDRRSGRLGARRSRRSLCDTPRTPKDTSTEFYQKK